MQATTTYEGYVPIPQARGIIHELVPAIPRPSDQFIRRAIKAGTVKATRVGPRRTLVNVHDVHGLITQVDPRIEQRIRELVGPAPEFSDELITKLRMLLGAEDGGDHHAA